MTGFLRPRIRAKLDGMAARLQQLTAQSGDPQILARPDRLAAIQRELGGLSRTIEKFEELQRVETQIEDNRSLMQPGSDKELAALAEAELPDLEDRARSLSEELIDILLAEEGDSRRDAIVEIRAGTGGEEAALFARDLCELYRRFAERMRWKVEVMHTSETELGGFKEVIFALRGDNVFHWMRFESGGHRVQRVPATESQGRIHTSAATVAVLPEAEDVEVHIEDKELRVDTYRSSGAGGQHVNKTDSAVRITHLPTGIVVACQDERSQHKNRARAMKLLRARLYDEQQRAQDAARAAERKGQVGSGDRSQRVRTYNFPQDRLTDHRIQRNFPLTQVLEGRLEPVLEALLAHDRESRLEQM